MPHPPRPPALSHGTASFLWAVGLALFIFFGMLAVSISKGTAIVVSVLSAGAIFFAVRLLGDEIRPPQKRKATHEGES